MRINYLYKISLIKIHNKVRELIGIDCQIWRHSVLQGIMKCKINLAKDSKGLMKFMIRSHFQILKMAGDQKMKEIVIKIKLKCKKLNWIKEKSFYIQQIILASDNHYHLWILILIKQVMDFWEINKVQITQCQNKEFKILILIERNKFIFRKLMTLLEIIKTKNLFKKIIRSNIFKL